jgi:hypothetical protein
MTVAFDFVHRHHIIKYINVGQRKAIGRLG